MNDRPCRAAMPLPVLSDLPVFRGRLHNAWAEAARRKGFTLIARVKDRYHLALQCQRCSSVTITKLFVLTSSQPLCRPCLETARAQRAAAVGLLYLGPDPHHTQYGFYRASCGHRLRRQFGLIDRVGEGKHGIRCGACFAARERKEAAALGWTRIGPDPQGNPNYHVYHHHCGHAQRIARANMNWAQIDCAGCGESWSAKPSVIYLFDIRHEGQHFLKLGYSGNPTKRQRHQLGLPPEARVVLRRSVAMPSGHAACATEKRLHARLRKRFPDAVVPPAEYRGLLNVTSEVYRPSLEAELHRAMDIIEARFSGGTVDPGGDP